MKVIVEKPASEDNQTTFFDLNNKYTHEQKKFQFEIGSIEASSRQQSSRVSSARREMQW